MPHHHLIRCLPDGTSEWLSLSREGRPLAGPRAGLPEGAAERVTLLLPAEEVLCLAAPRVARSAAALAQALPFAIEEQLAAPVERLQVAFDAGGDAASVATAVVDADYLRRQLGRMTEAGLSVDACHAEWQLLPGEGKRLWLEQGRAILVDPQRALCLPEAALEELAGWLAAQGWELQTLPRWRVGRCLEPAEQVVEAPLATLATGLGRRPFNLLQGAFAPRRRSLRQQRLWRLAAALLLAAASLATALPAIERRQLEAHVVQRQQAMAQLLRQTLPAVTRVVDPVAQMRSALRQSAGAGDGLQLLGRIAPLLAGGSRITLDALEYRNQVLDLTLIASDVATLDALRERVVSQGLQAELTAANPGSQGVEGRLRVAGGGS